MYISTYTELQVDSVPLPRKITSLLPRISFMHLQVTDLPTEDLLSHFPAVMEFVLRGVTGGGAVLLLSQHGTSRSPALATAVVC